MTTDRCYQEQNKNVCGSGGGGGGPRTEPRCDPDWQRKNTRKANSLSDTPHPRQPTVPPALSPIRTRVLSSPSGHANISPSDRTGGTDGERCGIRQAGGGRSSFPWDNGRIHGADPHAPRPSSRNPVLREAHASHYLNPSRRTRLADRLPTKTGSPDASARPQLRGAAARFSRSLMASPRPWCGMGATAILPATESS